MEIFFCVNHNTSYFFSYLVNFSFLRNNQLCYVIIRIVKLLTCLVCYVIQVVVAV